MSYLAWNCRRIGNTRAKRELKDMIQAQAPLIIFLSETWADKERLERFKGNIKYAGLFCVYSMKEGVVWRSFGSKEPWCGLTTFLNSILMQWLMGA